MFLHRKYDYSADLLIINNPIHLELIRVPAGPFLMGASERDNRARGDEMPQHTLILNEYFISKYLITNAQYAIFMKATSCKHLGYMSKGKIPRGKENHPVHYVSWLDARFFCQWLSWAALMNVRLPSEAEWEKAARGSNGQVYPWGDEPPTSDLCNYANNVGDTTPVGYCSPQGDSPVGCADMAGNVWEWTHTIGGRYPYVIDDGREEETLFGSKVMRGGAFYMGEDMITATHRTYTNDADNWAMPFGFRVVVIPRVTYPRISF